MRSKSIRPRISHCLEFFKQIGAESLEPRLFGVQTTFRIHELGDCSESVDRFHSCEIADPDQLRQMSFGILRFRDRPYLDRWLQLQSLPNRDLVIEKPSFPVRIRLADCGRQTHMRGTLPVVFSPVVQLTKPPPRMGLVPIHNQDNAIGFLIDSACTCIKTPCGRSRSRY